MGCAGSIAAGKGPAAKSSDAPRPIIIDKNTRKPKGVEYGDVSAFVIKDLHHPNGHREVPMLKTITSSHLHQRRSRSKESVGSNQSSIQSSQESTNDEGQSSMDSAGWSEMDAIVPERGVDDNQVMVGS
eukprot:gnl/TRDRNA2_/TRDRNA2_88406_c0_seq1.p1 gnl/TRDRNA2_/TRDRNA2_88406_c0~~gnl/TRDRNA2_/TRDRNA2_88406_c0_seq1.p1  ORF type:complete len:129 (-),score=17.32 gnl/TRDRNA2_/TRDRNA2_88406_c0_seq1:78-464(-)